MALQHGLPARIRRRPRRQGPRRIHRAHVHRRADPHRARQEALAGVVPGAHRRARWARFRPPGGAWAGRVVELLERARCLHRGWLFPHRRCGGAPRGQDLREGAHHRHVRLGRGKRLSRRDCRQAHGDSRRGGRLRVRRPRPRVGTAPRGVHRAHEQGVRTRQSRPGFRQAFPSEDGALWSRGDKTAGKTACPEAARLLSAERSRVCRLCPQPAQRRALEALSSQADLRHGKPAASGHWQD